MIFRGIQRFSWQIIFLLMLATVLTAGPYITRQKAQASNATTILISTPFRQGNQILDLQTDIPSISGDASIVGYQFGPFVFARDRNILMPEPISVSFDQGVLAPAVAGSLSRDGSLVAFASNSTNILANNLNGRFNVFVRQRGGAATPELISVTVNSIPADGDSFNPTISGNGRFVVFVSNANNLVTETLGRTVQVNNIYLRDRTNNTTRLISANADGSPFNLSCDNPVISEDGTTIAFQSGGAIFIQRNGMPAQQLPNALGQLPVVSANGNVLAFVTSNNIIIVDLVSNRREIMNVSDFNIPANLQLRPSLSRDGRFLAFSSALDRFVMNDTNLRFDVFVLDRQGGGIERVSLTETGLESPLGGINGVIDNSGRFVVFSSTASLTINDTDASNVDIYLRDRGDGFGNIIGGGGGLIVGRGCIITATATAEEVTIKWGSGTEHAAQLARHKVMVTKKNARGIYETIAMLPADKLDIFTDKDVKPRTKYEYSIFLIDPRGYGYATDFKVRTKKAK